jgi:hypothetical protein
MLMSSGDMTRVKNHGHLKVKDDVKALPMGLPKAKINSNIAHKPKK